MLIGCQMSRMHRSGWSCICYPAIPRAERGDFPWWYLKSIYKANGSEIRILPSRAICKRLVREPWGSPFPQTSSNKSGQKLTVCKVHWHFFSGSELACSSPWNFFERLDVIIDLLYNDNGEFGMTNQGSCSHSERNNASPFADNLISRVILLTDIDGSSSLKKFVNSHIDGVWTRWYVLCPS